jgi:hypothetical protein
MWLAVGRGGTGSYVAPSLAADMSWHRQQRSYIVNQLELRAESFLRALHQFASVDHRLGFSRNV